MLDTAFLSPFWGLGATYDVHLRLIGKCVVNFLLVLIELFSLGAEALRANIDWKSAISLQRSRFHPKFQVEGVALTSHSFSQKTRLNDMSYDIKICPDFYSVLSQFTRLTDRQTDRQTDRHLLIIASPRWHSMQRGKKQTDIYTDATQYMTSWRRPYFSRVLCDCVKIWRAGAPLAKPRTTGVTSGSFKLQCIAIATFSSY